MSFDALRADALGLYGYPKRTSPRLDAFAREAIVFENAYSVAPKTPASFAGAFTGRYPTTSLRDWRLQGKPTLAQRFSDAGYRTAAFLNNPQLGRKRGFAAGFGRYRAYWNAPDSKAVSDALAWLDEQAEEPFFVWLHLIDPHAPWQRRDTSNHLYDESYRGKFEERAGGSLWQADPEELERLRSLYDGEIFFADLAFGRVLDHLEARGLLDRTVVVFTSDHGEEFMEHGRLQHGWLTEENVRIPLLIRDPREPRARRYPGRVTNLDLLPTLAELAGLDGSGGLDGRSVLAGSADDRPLIAVAHTSRTSQAASIREGSWKLIVRCGIVADRFLYDLEADPGESRNLVSQAAARADELESRLWQELGLAGCSELPISTANRGDAERRSLDPEAIEALKQLGYLEE